MRSWFAAFAIVAATGVLGAQSRPQTTTRPASPDAQYQLGPDSQQQPGVPRGKILEFELADSKTYPGFARKWWLYVPQQHDGKKPCSLMVFLDGGSYVKRDGAWRVPIVFDNLIAKGAMPVTVALFVNPGEATQKRPDGTSTVKRNRSVEYDTVPDSQFEAPAEIKALLKK